MQRLQRKEKEIIERKKVKNAKIAKNGKNAKNLIMQRTQGVHKRQKCQEQYECKE